MAATHAWKESNGAGEDVSTITNINFGSNDSPNLNTTTYPVIAGESSFEKYIRCLFTDVWTEISNMKFWKSAGDYKTGEVIKADVNVSYVQPSDTPNADDNIPTDEGSALLVKSAEGEDTIVYDDSGVSGYTGYIRLQLQTTGSTPAGAVNTKTFTFQYDEV